MRQATLASPTPTTSAEPQPSVGASIIAQSSRPRAAIESTPPQGSGRLAAWFFESGTSTRAPTIPATTIGTFTTKIEPHQKLASSTPPAIGPMAMPSPIVPAQAPMARARSEGWRKMSLMIESDDGIVRAAPTPISPRNAMSGGTEPEQAAPIDPAPNTARPMMKNRLRPKRSARLPPTSNNPAKTMA